MSDASKIIATAGIISVGVGTVNSFSKNHTPPSARFLIGSGAAFLIISAIAEAEPQVGQALALAVMTTVILGEGGGVLTYISGRGEIDTTKPVSTFVPKGRPATSPRQASQTKRVNPSTPFHPRDVRAITPLS